MQELRQIMDEPSTLITIIIPTYKRPRLLRRALTSALNQTYSSFQVYVYDNASSDETREVVDEFMQKDPRVKYHCHSENIGMIGNYECAMSEVRTPYFSLLSDDDVIFPWFLEEAMKGFQSYPDIAFSAASTIIMSEKGEVVRVPLDLWSREGYFPSIDGLTEMISKYPIPTCILFRKEVIEEIPIDTDNALTWDCDFLLQITARHPIFISKRPCGIFLHHESSYSNAQDFGKWEYSLNRMKNRLGNLKHFSLETQNSLQQLIEDDLKACNRAFIHHSLFHKKFLDAYDYAKIFLKNYGKSSSSLILLIISRLCTWFPPTIYPLFLIRKIMRFKKTQPYSSYKKYISFIV